MLLLPAVGAEGGGFMVTVVVPLALAGHPLTVVVTEYVPGAAVVTPAMVGFCDDEVKLLGPVHE